MGKAERDNQTIIAIDPGPEQSAGVLFNGGVVSPTGAILQNEVVRSLLWSRVDDHTTVLAIEGMECHGMQATGKETFTACIWIGRFIEAWGGDWGLIYRSEEKMHLCHNMRAKDKNIRQALIDRYGPGKEKAIGLKKTPGPLYGFKSHMWSALAVGVTYLDLGFSTETEGE